MGWDSISSSEQADNRHSDILSGSWIFSDTSLSPGSGQSEYGRSFQWSGVKGVVTESLDGQKNTQVDLFASRVGSPSSIFLHIQEGQESKEINALVQRWKFKKKYAFPPPQLFLYKYAWQSRCDRYNMYLKHDPL